MWRAFSSSPPSTAAAAPPPLAITATARNCEPPAKISSDIAHTIGASIPDARASTPKDAPIAPTAMPMVIPSRRIVRSVERIGRYDGQP